MKTAVNVWGSGKLAFCRIPRNYFHYQLEYFDVVSNLLLIFVEFQLNRFAGHLTLSICNMVVIAVEFIKHHVEIWVKLFRSKIRAHIFAQRIS